MILLVYYHRVIRATRNCQLSHKRGITFSILNDSVDKCRLCLLTLRHIISGLPAGEMRAEEREKPSRRGDKPSPGLSSAEQGRRRGGREESPRAVGRSHTHSVQQQPRFTKRHLFHYFDALWLITSWPVCEMTATYSPVNRKICTCSVWAAGSERGAGSGGRMEREDWEKGTGGASRTHPASLGPRCQWPGRGQRRQAAPNSRASTVLHSRCRIATPQTFHLPLKGFVFGEGARGCQHKWHQVSGGCNLPTDFCSLSASAVYTFLTCQSGSFVRGYYPMCQFNFRLGWIKKRTSHLPSPPTDF